MSKVNLKIFGDLKERMPSSCGCGGSTKLVADAYKELESFLKEASLDSSVNLDFVQVNEENISDYEKVEQALNSGFKLPMTMINEKVRFHGNISTQMIYRAIRRAL